MKRKNWNQILKTSTDMFAGELKHSLLIRALSGAAYYQKNLGSQNEHRFDPPHQLDRGAFPRLGFKCVQEKSYDLIINSEDEDIKISTKMGIGLFHTKSGKLRKSTESGIIMSNSRHGKSKNKTKFPIFDVLLLIQINPYLVCGMITYPKINDYMNIKSGGCTLSSIPVENIKFIISPEEYLPPMQLTDAEKNIIDIEVYNRKEAAMMGKYLDLKQN